MYSLKSPEAAVACLTLHVLISTHLNKVSWLLLTRPPRISSSCQCMNFRLKPWQPPWRRPAMSGLWMDEQEQVENTGKYVRCLCISRVLLASTCNLVLYMIKLWVYLSFLLVGCTERAVRVRRVQTWPVHVSMSHLRNKTMLQKSQCTEKNKTCN